MVSQRQPRVEQFVSLNVNKVGPARKHAQYAHESNVMPYESVTHEKRQMSRTRVSRALECWTMGCRTCIYEASNGGQMTRPGSVRPKIESMLNQDPARNKFVEWGSS